MATIVKIKRLTPSAKLPKRDDKEDAAYDCFIDSFAQLDEKGVPKKIESEFKSIELQPLARVLCMLGFATAIPSGYYMQVLPRSGNSAKKGITIHNTPGTIDSGYRNEWSAITVNISGEPVKLSIGDKICQIVLKKIESVEFEEINELPASNRGLKGFGSSDEKKKSGN